MNNEFLEPLHRELLQRLTALEIIAREQGVDISDLRNDVKSLLQFRAAWLAVTGLVSTIIAGGVAFFVSGK